MLSIWLLTSATVGTATAYMVARYYRQLLASQVRNSNVKSADRRSSRASGELEGIPSDLLEHPEDFRILHEKDEIVLRTRDILDHKKVEELFTKLLRRNMRCFSQLPQSYMLWLILRTPEQRRSFSRPHIENLDFEKGDLVCGAYRVLSRSPLRVELGMEAAKQMAYVSGRLMISLRPRDESAVLATETLQWTHAGGPVLPLERAPIKFMHEMASWWLLVSGARYVESLHSASDA